MSIVCEYCNISYANKYILKNHLETNKKCLLIRGEDISISRICEGCNDSFTTKGNVIKHQQHCQLYLLKEENKKIKHEQEELLQKLNSYTHIIDIETELKSLQIEMKALLTKHDAEMNMVKLGYESKIQQLDKQIDTLNTIIKETLSDSVKKSTTTVTQNTQHISYRDCLSKEHTVDQLNEKHLVERLRISMTESMFFGGLRDIARLCYDCIVKLKSGKMILCCTDVSRGKFKMYDLHGNIKEDIEARYFTEKVGKCIRVAANDIYKCIVDSIQDEQSMLTETDYKRKEELIDKYKRTCDAYIEIINVDDPGHNSEFINELAALTSVNAIVTPLCPNINSKRSIHDLL